MKSYAVIEVKFGSSRYEQTVSLRDRVMKKPLGLSLYDFDLSYERDATVLAVFDADTDTIMGTGILVFEDDVTAKIRYLCVDPALQKGDIGRAIIEDIEKRSLQRGIKKICLDARVTAMNFYKKLGYLTYGEIYSLEEAPVEHIWMEKAL